MHKDAISAVLLKTGVEGTSAPAPIHTNEGVPTAADTRSAFQSAGGIRDDRLELNYEPIVRRTCARSVDSGTTPRMTVKKCTCQGAGTRAAGIERPDLLQVVNDFRNESSKVTQELLQGSQWCAYTTSDCAIRALMHVMRVPYDEAHEYLRPFRDCNCSGTRTRPALESLPLADQFERLSCFVEGRITLAQFVARHSVGRYLVIVRQHALAVIDGKLYDHTLGPNRLVRAAYYYKGRG